MNQIHYFYVIRRSPRYKVIAIVSSFCCCTLHNLAQFMFVVDTNSKMNLNYLRMRLKLINLAVNMT